MANRKNPHLFAFKQYMRIAKQVLIQQVDKKSTYGTECIFKHEAYECRPKSKHGRDQ